MLLAILTAHFTYRNGDICSIETVELFWHLALYPWAQFWYTLCSISEHPWEWSVPMKIAMFLLIYSVASIDKMELCMTLPPSFCSCTLNLPFSNTRCSIPGHLWEWSIPIKYVMPLILYPVVSIHKMRPCMTLPPSSIRGPFVFRSWTHGVLFMNNCENGQFQWSSSCPYSYARLLT